MILTTNLAPKLSSKLTMGATLGRAAWQWRLVTCDIVGIQWRWLINVGSTWSGSLVNKMVTCHPCHGIMMIFSNLLAQIHKVIRQEFFRTMWQKFTTKTKHWSETAMKTLILCIYTNLFTGLWMHCNEPFRWLLLWSLAIIHIVMLDGSILLRGTVTFTFFKIRMALLLVPHINGTRNPVLGPVLQKN